MIVALLAALAMTPQPAGSPPPTRACPTAAPCGEGYRHVAGPAPGGQAASPPD